MQTELEIIKKYLDSEAGLAEDSKGKERIIDNRFELIKIQVCSIENKDDAFYSDLIKLISIYVDKLYDSKVDNPPVLVFNIDGELIPQNQERLSRWDKYYLSDANHDFSKNLFLYVCDILKANPNIKLDLDTLRRLLNRSPKLFTLSIETDFISRSLNFKKLAKIMHENQTLKKSGLNIDDIYQLLIDTYQLDNEDVFGTLVERDDFKANNKKIIDLLSNCNSSTFIKITNIILRNFNKNFDRMTLVKARKEKDFPELLITRMGLSYINEDDYNFIHQLLNDEDISIDYDFDYFDYYGQTSLKEIVALSGKRTLIKDLLSKPENIQDYYWHGEIIIELYQLYAIIGDYENALNHFKNHYYFESIKNGQIKVEYTYEDSLAKFIKNICNSFIADDIDYIKRKEIIDSILASENVRCINIDETLPILQTVLSSEDFEELINSLVERCNSGTLGFITCEKTVYECFIKISSEDEINKSLAALKETDKSFIFVKKCPHQS